MRKSSALFIFVIVVSTFGNSQAQSVIVDATKASSGSRVEVGPASVTFLAINPLVFPTWTATEDDVAKAAPNPPVLSNGSTVVGPIDQDFKPSASTIAKNADVLLPQYAPSAPVGGISPKCLLDPKDAEFPTQVGSCADSVKTRYGSIKETISNQQQQLSEAIRSYNKLPGAVGAIIARPQTRGLSEDGSNPSNLTVEQQIGTYDKAISKEILGSLFLDFVAKVDAVPSWPSEQVSSLSEDMTVLKTTLENQSAKDVKDSARTYGVTPAVLADWLGTLKTIQAGSTAQTQYDNALSQLRDWTNSRVRNATVSRFRFHDDENCSGLNGGSRKHTYVLSLDSTTATTVQVSCENRMFLSEGIMFSTVGQRKFVGAPVNPGPTPSSTTAPDMVSAEENADLRPIAMVLVNYRMASHPDSRTFLSFGGGLSSGSQNTFVDYVAGFSYGAGRELLVTVGEHLGQETVLAPGYSLGQQIQGDPKTTTHYRLAPFIGISFGRP